MIVFDKSKADEEKLMNMALEAGAADVRETEKEFEVITEPGDFEAVKKSWKRPAAAPLCGGHDGSAVYHSLTGKEAQQMVRLMESLEDSDDVQHVYANFDISDAEMEQLSA